MPRMQPIAARDGSNPASDVVVDLVGQICQRHAQRPVRRFEAAAVQQHDPVVLGQAEGEIERMDVLLKVLDGILADVLLRPELEIDQAVVCIVERVLADCEAETFKQSPDAPLDDLAARFLVALLAVHQFGQRETGSS